MGDQAFERSQVGRVGLSMDSANDEYGNVVGCVSHAGRLLHPAFLCATTRARDPGT